MANEKPVPDVAPPGGEDAADKLRKALEKAAGSKPDQAEIAADDSGASAAVEDDEEA